MTGAEHEPGAGTEPRWDGETRGDETRGGETRGDETRGDETRGGETRGASGPGTDPNAEAVRRAGVDPAHAAWLANVATTVPGRLDAVVPGWREAPEPAAVLAAVFGLATGALAARYPQSRPAVHAVVEAHPSFEAFPGGRRLEVLERLARDPALVVRWLEPMLPRLDEKQVSALLA